MYSTNYFAYVCMDSCYVAKLVLEIEFLANLLSNLIGHMYICSALVLRIIHSLGQCYNIQKQASECKEHRDY